MHSLGVESFATTKRERGADLMCPIAGLGALELGCESSCVRACVRATMARVSSVGTGTCKDVEHSNRTASRKPATLVQGLGAPSATTIVGNFRVMAVKVAAVLQSMCFVLWVQDGVECGGE